MNSLLNLDRAPSSVDPIIDCCRRRQAVRLQRFELYPQLCHEIRTDALVAEMAIVWAIDLEYTSTESAQKYAELEQSPSCQGMNERQLEAIADRELRLQKFKLARWGSEVEPYFVAQGGGLDRVILSILQVADGSLAQELFFRIQSGEQSFAEIALNYSQGIHAQNAGILGPLLLRELTPGIREIVAGLAPGELSVLFPVDNYYTFFRLDEREPAQLDARMYQFLLDELFSTWLESQLSMQVELPKLPIPPAQLHYHLSRSKLLVKYLRSTIIEETLAVWESSPEFGSICTRLNIDPNNCQEDLLELYKQTEFSRLVRSRFLGCKSQLDRVLFSVIQVRNLQLAEELYCRIKEENQSFTRIATTYSDGQSAKRGGVIGPISALQLHPSIQHHLIGLKPKQLSSIFQLDEHYILLRLDRSLPVQLIPQIEQQLRDQLFEEWLQQQILDRLKSVSTDRISNIHLPMLPPVKQCVEIEISSDPDLNSEPTGMLCPTSAIFFAQTVPPGEIITPNLAIGQNPNSSFFFPPASPAQILTPRYRRHRLVKQTVAFFVFFWLSLAGGIFAVRLFSQPAGNPHTIAYSLGVG